MVVFVIISSILLKVAMAMLWYVICNIGFPCCPCMKSSFALFLVCNIISLLTAISPFVPQWGEIFYEVALHNCLTILEIVKQRACMAPVHLRKSILLIQQAL